MIFKRYLFNSLFLFFTFYAVLHSENAQDSRGKENSQLQNTLSDTTKVSDYFRVWSELSVPKVLFDYRERLIYNYMTLRAYEAAMSEIAYLRQDAQRAKYLPGVAASYELMGLAYLRIGQDEEAAEAFEEGQRMICLLGDPLHEVRTNYYLSLCYMRLGDLDKMKQTLDRWKTLLDDHPQIIPIEGNSPWYCLLYSYYVNYFVATQNPEMAKQQLNQATRYFNSSYTNRYVSAYNLALARYYHLLGEHDLALCYVARASLVDNSNEPTDVKLSILKGAGRVSEALALYDSIGAHTQKSRVLVYARQVDQLNALHKLTQEELQELEMDMQQHKIERQKILLTAILLFLGLVSALLVVLMHSAWRMNRLKGVLEKEQELLQHSSRRLKEEKDKAEAANTMKTAFVTNINYDIRIPLNAITGFAGLLETVEGEEQAEFVRIINTNTARLLELVNDILSLSKLESEQFQSNLQSFDINGCCQEAISLARPLFAAGVKVSLVCLPNSCFIYSDPELVREVLVNLLKHAAGRMTEGEVVLRCDQGEASEQLCLSVSEQKQGANSTSQQTEEAEPDDLRLSICRVAAKKVGGSLFFDTTYIGGAHRFVFCLPHSCNPNQVV